MALPLAETPSRETAVGVAVDRLSVAASGPGDEVRLDRAFRVDGHVPGSVHVYGDVNGAPVGAVARYEPGTLEADRKSFRQFRREGERWLSGLNAIKLPLYNLSSVAQAVAAGERVYIVEGERCADLLTGFGVCATTNSGGAGKWGELHTSPLAGADVVMIEDDDEPGRAHMDKVAAALTGVAKSVRRISAPGVESVARGQGYDVADWIRAGGQLAELLSRIEGSQAASIVSDEWPTPIAFGPPAEAEPFPVQDALPPMCAELALAIAATVKVDPTAPAVFIPCVISAAAGNAYSLQVSRSFAEPNLARYAIWSKASGERGSQTHRVVTQPLTQWTEDAHREFQNELERTSATNTVVLKRIETVAKQAAKATDESKRAALAAEIQGLRKELRAVPVQPMLFIGDTTSESLVREMATRYGALAVISADARKTIDHVLGRYRSDGKTDDSAYLLAHGGDCIDRSRVGTTSQGELLRIEHPSLAVALAVQPDKLAEIAVNASLLQSGFLPRCNVFQPNSLVGTRFETGDEQPLNAQLAAKWENVVRAIVDERFRILQAKAGARWSPRTLVLDDGAMELRRLFANEIEQRQAPGGDLHGLSGFGSKCAGEAARLAGLFHLALMAEAHTLPSAADTPILASTWALAERHQRWQLAETLRVLALAQEDVVTKLARRLLEWMARRPAERGVVALRDLIASRIVGNADDAGSVLTWLAERGWTKQIAPVGRTQAPRWQVHPVVFGGGAS
jgi:hypothetical protein